MGFIFKVARTEREFAQIHSLNYRTFVEEIPQHPEEKNRLRIDPFHHENTYLICIKEDELIGMIAVRSKRPFSLDKKIGQVEKYLPIKADSLCEIRLLAVEMQYRTGRVFFGLFQCLARYCLDQGYDAAVISGTTLQTKLYLQLGFQPFYEKIGTEQAQFIPMFMTKAMFEKFLSERIPLTSYSFLPGPVVPEKEVTDALIKPSISHRSKQFHHLFSSVKEKLLQLTNSRHCQILFGSGTLANDVIALQLRKHGKGLILVNGEFGSRLARQAKRVNLEFIPFEIPWGKSFFQEEIYSMLVKHQCKWIWFTHCETSTGMRNPLENIIEIAEELDVKVCLDAISSIGAIPLDLRHVYLASGVSGKAIGSYSGLSFVFHQEEIVIDPSIPAYLDLGYYSENESIPFTHSSNLMAALNAAL